MHDRFRDYAYVSARKVVRMSKTLEPPAWNRVRDLEVKLGPVGATLSFDAGARPEDVIVLVTEVERAIGKRFGIHELNDPRLRVGHWFQVTATPMIHGVPSGVLGGVLFLGSSGPAGPRFVLGGSSDYLLNPMATGGQGPGALSPGVLDMLRVFVGESLSDHDPAADGNPAFKDIGFDRLADRLTSGSEPMTALARCLDIVTTADPPVVIGTPLYVALHTPGPKGTGATPRPLEGQR